MFRNFVQDSFRVNVSSSIVAALKVKPCFSFNFKLFHLKWSKKIFHLLQKLSAFLAVLFQML